MSLSFEQIRRFLPFLSWLPGVDRSTLKADFSAGITGAVVVLPQGVAFAAIAGMPPQYGLYAAMVPAIIAALFGSSHHLVSGPTTAASLVMFSALSALAEPGSADYIGLAITLTFLVGLTEFVMGLARLGTLVNFISHSVIVGFTSGAALLIAGSQLKHMFGLDIERTEHFHDTILAVGVAIGDLNPYALSVALVTLVVGALVKRINRKMPYMIIAMLAGSVLAVAFDWILGHEVSKLAFVGALPAELPPLSAPRLDLATLKDLAPAVLAATLFALTEAVSISRSLAVRSGQTINGNQEFIGQGLSNIIGSFFSAYIATGSFNRSGVNYDAGARTPIAALVAGVLLVGLVLIVAPLTAYLPKAAMAGLLLLVAWGLFDFHHFAKIFQASRSEGVVTFITFFATLLLELEFAILLGVLASLAVYLRRTSKPNIQVRTPDLSHPGRKFTTDARQPECPQLSMVRIDGSIWFGAVSYIRERLRHLTQRRPEQKHLLLLTHGVNFVDVAGAEFLASEARKRTAMGGAMYLYKLKPGVCEPLNKGDYYRDIGAENTFDTKTEAIATIVENLDPKVCEACTARIFRECAGRPGGSDA